MRYAVPVICLLSFAVLAAAMLAGLTAPADLAIRESIHRLASDNLTTLSVYLSFVGSSPVWLAAAVLIAAGLWLAGRRKQASALAACLLGAIVLENVLKLVLHRARPDVFFGTLPATYSFPSGHALFAMCFYGALAIIATDSNLSIQKRAFVWFIAILLVLGIGLSRIYLGVHYPSDVLAGYLAGAAWIACLHAAGVFDSGADGRKGAAR